MLRGLLLAVNASQFLSGLSRQLPSVTLLHGDEPLQLGECLDALRAAARDQGVNERISFDASTGFDWNDLGASADNFSLFAERRLFEVRLSGRPGADGASAAERMAQGANDLLVIVCPRLEGQAMRTAWFKKLDAVATSVAIQAVQPNALPRWLSERFARAGISASREACELLAERTEGNLLAAAQEVDKLALISEGAELVDVDAITSAAADSARFSAFDLVDAAVDGDAPRVVRVLGALRAEGMELPPLLGSVTWMIRNLLSVSQEVRRGKPLDAVLNQGPYRQLGRRGAGVRRVVSHLGSEGVANLLAAAHQVDRSIKGQSVDEPWSALERMCLELAGANALASPTRASRARAV